MYIVFCREISIMGERFDDPEKMGKYIANCLSKFPHAKIKVELYI